MADFELLALVFGDSPPSNKLFSVMASPAGSVSKLKQLVHKEKKRNRFKDIDSGDLVLWKLNNPIPVDGVDAGVATLGQNLSTLATKMMPGYKLAFYFATAPQRGHLHVIVQPPSLPSAGQKHGLSDGDADSNKRRHVGSLDEALCNGLGSRQTARLRQKNPYPIAWLFATLILIATAYSYFHMFT